ncbi:hypothetical protein D3C75_638680 [compost metagenome]
MLQESFGILEEAVEDLQQHNGAYGAGDAACGQVADQRQVHGALTPMLEGAKQLGDGVIEQIRAHRNGGMDADHHKKRSQERGAADAGQTYQQPHQKSQTGYCPIHKHPSPFR